MTRCPDCGGEGGGGTMDPDEWFECATCEGAGGVPDPVGSVGKVGPDGAVGPDGLKGPEGVPRPGGDRYR